MTKWLIRIFGGIVIAALAVVVVVNTTRAQMPEQGLPRNPFEMLDVGASTKVPPCSIATIAGAWVFATDVGFYSGGVPTAICMGTNNISKDGTLKSKYDIATLDGFFGGISWAGTVKVNPDCTGTLTQHDVGSDVNITSSIVIADSGREIWGMFQDAKTWSLVAYRLKRITEPSDK